MPIPDGGNASTSINVGDSGTITDLDVDLIIQHTWQGDRIIELGKSGGPTVPPIYRPGYPDVAAFGFSSDNYGNPSSGDVFLLDDEAASFYDNPDVAYPDFNNPTGAWRPYGSASTDTLGTFDGLDSSGLWTLYVSDNALADTGSVLQFSLHFTTAETGNQNAPVPEPGTLALLLAAGGLAVVRRRRRRRAA